MNLLQASPTVLEPRTLALDLWVFLDKLLQPLSRVGCTEEPVNEVVLEGAREVNQKHILNLLRNIVCVSLCARGTSSAM